MNVIKTSYSISDTDIWKLLGKLEDERDEAIATITDCERRLQRELLDECLGKTRCKSFTRDYKKQMKWQIEYFTVKKDLYSQLIANIENGVYVEGESS